jgi:hypothetical protein
MGIYQVRRNALSQDSSAASLEAKVMLAASAVSAKPKANQGKGSATSSVKKFQAAIKKAEGKANKGGVKAKGQKLVSGTNKGKGSATSSVKKFQAAIKKAEGKANKGGVKAKGQKLVSGTNEGKGSAISSVKKFEAAIKKAEGKAHQPS